MGSGVAMTITQNYNENFIGQKFGRLTIVGFDKRVKTPGSQFAFWFCKCECGNTISVKRGSLTSGNTRSCGCLANELTAQRNRKHLSDSQCTAVYFLYKKYRQSAKRRGYDFNIDIDEFSLITKENCIYCGCEPSTVVKSNWGDEYVHNGIDRLDNSRGYTSDNIAPCCSVCNRAKNKMNYDDFMNWIDKIIRHNRSTE